MLGIHDKGYSSLLISKTAMVPEEMQGHVYEISKLFTDEDHRREGSATALLKDIFTMADKEKKALALCPETLELQKWYARLGFVCIQAKPPVMVRMPNE